MSRMSRDHCASESLVDRGLESSFAQPMS